MFEYSTEFCPFGREMVPGRVQVAWTPCICEPAKEADSRGHGLGHAVLRCRSCEDEGRSAVFYDPPHDRRGGTQLDVPPAKLTAFRGLPRRRLAVVMTTAAGRSRTPAGRCTAVRSLTAYRFMTLICWPTPPGWAAIVQAMC
jgi:hypothetical protein